MPSHPEPPNESARIEALQRYGILDTSPEEVFDDIARLSAQISGYPIALVTLVDTARVWFKARVGLDATESSREGSLCAAAIQSGEGPFIVTDAISDPRFASRPYVTGDPKIRSYVGIPLVPSEGFPLGTLCVLDSRPREPEPGTLRALQSLARQVVAQLELRRVLIERNSMEIEFRSIVESATDAIVCSDSEGRITLWNSAARKIYGYTAEEAVGQPLTIIMPEKFRAGHGAAMAFLRAGGESPMVGKTVSLVGVRKDGTEFPIEMSVGQWRAGDRLFFAGIIRDVSERVQMSRALQESEERRHLLEELARSRFRFENLVGKGAAMQEVFRRLRLAAQSDVTVLLSGESGTGKELAAGAIHALSARKEKPLVVVNCASIPETLLESELFGHVRGAFTGAVRDKQGLFEVANGGTLFLDEVGDMPPALQVKVLRALQSREIRRVGGDRPLTVNVRIVAATNRDLKALLATGGMREDFYYRIRVFEIVLPPLRERREDIPLLVDHFLAELERVREKTVEGLSPRALRKVLDYGWPGNVRELRNALEHAFVTMQGTQIDLSDFPPEIRGSEGRARGQAERSAVSGGREERERLLVALRKAKGNRNEAAKLLGISRVTLWKRMRRFGIEDEDVAGASGAASQENP
jgi:PAS domain S-box-containing protein